MKVACIIGAGYSAAVGLPLGDALLNGPVAVATKKAAQRFTEVRNDFEKWKGENPGGAPEQYLADVYLLFNRVIPFEWAVDLIVAVLATASFHSRRGTAHPRTPASFVRYEITATQPSKNAILKEFWKTVFTHANPTAIATSNYDLLIEQVLRHRPMRTSLGGGFHYGGLPRPQLLRGRRSIVRRELEEMVGTIPLFKLHGSMNWSRAHGGLELFQDMRAAFRTQGKAAIVPPLPEKMVPGWLTEVWSSAAEKLAEGECWIVCGYSIPPYDLQVQQLLARCGRNVNKVILLDPMADLIADRWSAVAPKAKIVRLPGLPDGIPSLKATLHQLRFPDVTVSKRSRSSARNGG